VKRLDNKLVYHKKLKIEKILFYVVQSKLPELNNLLLNDCYRGFVPSVSHFRISRIFSDKARCLFPEWSLVRALLSKY